MRASQELEKIPRACTPCNNNGLLEEGMEMNLSYKTICEVSSCNNLNSDIKGKVSRINSNLMEKFNLIHGTSPTGMNT